MEETKEPTKEPEKKPEQPKEPPKEAPKPVKKAAPKPKPAKPEVRPRYLDPVESKSDKKREKTAIEKDAQINQIIQRDNKFYSINENFHLDLKTLKIIAIKPNQVKPEHLKMEESPQDIPEFIQKKIQEDLFLTPKDKYEYPLTHSQEIGWESAVGLNTHKRRSKPQCDVTLYANEYVKANGRSPYATKDKKVDGKKGS